MNSSLRSTAASSLISEMLTNGDNKQRKRGRPRTLDGPEDEPSFSPRIVSVQGTVGLQCLYRVKSRFTVSIQGKQ